MAKKFMIRNFFKETNLAQFLRLFNIEDFVVLGDFKLHIAAAYSDCVKIIRKDTKESTVLCG
jgi:hypothetical protein